MMFRDHRRGAIEPGDAACKYCGEAVKHRGIEDDQVASSFTNDPAHWRHRAEEMRTLAEGMSSSETRQIMMRIATDYERLAERAEQRGKGTSGPKSDGDGRGR